MINNFQEYTKAVNRIEREKLDEIRELRKQLIRKITSNDDSIVMEDIVYLNVDMDCYTGELRSRKKINLKPMEKELHIRLNQEDKFDRIFYNGGEEKTIVQYVYYFDIYYD